MSLVDGIGCWVEQATFEPGFRGRPALFLDRDGVVMVEHGFVSSPDVVELHDGAAAIIAAANVRGVAVVLVTNQSGVARGMYDWTAFAAVQTELVRRLHAADARLDLVLACGYHRAGSGSLGVADHPWRKPRPGMLLEARGRLGIDLRRSWIVGDRATDLEAGRAAGLAGGTHVMTGHATDHERAQSCALATDAFDVATGASITDALPSVHRLSATVPT